MKLFSKHELEIFLDKHAISLASPELNIGQHLSFKRPNKRTVIIHLNTSDTDKYITEILKLFFSLDDEWLILPRYGSITKITAFPSGVETCAVSICNDRIDSLINEMIRMQKSNEIIEIDPYILASSGEIIAAWDHHVFSDGFVVSFSSTQKSTLFISTLNNVGVEFDVLYSDT